METTYFTKSIDLKGIIASQNLDPKELAKQLFPGNKHPKLALNRVLAGEAVLDADQISKLASLTGLTPDELYSENGWKSTSKNGKMIFQNGDYKAELDTETWVTKIFHNDSLFHETVMTPSTTPISTYIKQLELIISKNKQHGKN